MEENSETEKEEGEEMAGGERRVIWGVEKYFVRLYLYIGNCYEI